MQARIDRMKVQQAEAIELILSAVLKRQALRECYVEGPLPFKARWRIYTGEGDSMAEARAQLAHKLSVLAVDGKLQGPEGLTSADNSDLGPGF